MKWIIVCSTDGINVDHEEILERESEPDFWECSGIAEDHGCEWWYLDSIEEEV